MRQGKIEVNRTVDGVSLAMSNAQHAVTFWITPQEARELAAALLVVSEAPAGARPPESHMHMGFRL